MSRVYLDYAAATPLDKRVLKAMQPYLGKRFANPSSLHQEGRDQAVALEESRKRVAKVLGAKPAEVVFTSGSTEGINLAIQGVANSFPGGRVVMSTIEHEAVRNVCNHLESLGRPVGVVTVGANGVVDPEQVRLAVNDHTVLLCMQYVNHEIGTIQPLAKIAQVVAEIRQDRAERLITTPLYLFCDAAQAGSMSLAVARLGVDMMSLGASKLYGPSGVGVLYIKSGTPLEPIIFGGGQESGWRSGTEPVSWAVGMAAALELADGQRSKETQRQLKLRDWLWGELNRKVDGLSLNGDAKQRSAANLNFSVQGASGEALLAYLDKAGFAVATGSACSAGSGQPSAVLLAIGLTQTAADSSLRVTLGRATTKAELARFVKAFHASVARVRELSQSAS